MRIRLNRQSAGVALAGLGAVTLLLTGVASGAPLFGSPQAAVQPCVSPLDPLNPCPTPTGTSTATGTATSTGTGEPTETGTGEPTETGTGEPTETGTGEPTETGTGEPTETGEPTGCPTGDPTDTGDPTGDPTDTGEPTATGTGTPSPTGIVLPTLPTIIQAPIPGVTTTETGEPTETGTPDPEPTDCLPAGAPTKLTYAATRRARFADLYTFSAKVTKAGGVAVSGGTVSFLLPGFTYTGPVGSDGYARVRVRLAINPANYRMNLRYNPAAGFLESKEQVGFTVVKTSSSCELYRQVTATQSKLTGALRYPDRSRIPGVGVVFWYNGRPLANRVTNTIGVATLDTTRGRRGDTFTFTFPGDAKRTGCSITIRVP